MKIGELYYGISIPQSEFRRVEQQLKRFETAMKQAGGREIAAAMRSTTTAATQQSSALTKLRNEWKGIQDSYAAGSMSAQNYVDSANLLQETLRREMAQLDKTTKEWGEYASFRTQVNNAMSSETARMDRMANRTGQAQADSTKQVLRATDSYSTLITTLKALRSEMAILDSNQRRGLITGTEALAQYQQIIASLDQEKAAINRSNAAYTEKRRALGDVARASNQAQNAIDRLQLSTQGYNRFTLQGIQLSDSLTKAWLIGLGPQGYRLYLVMDVLKSTMDGLNKSMKASYAISGVLGAAFTALKAVSIGGLLVAIGAAVAGISQMLSVEDALADVAKTTNLSKDEIDGLTRAFRNLSTRLPSTVTELAEIAAAAGQLGIRGQKNIYEFTEAIAEMNLVVNDLGEEPAVKLGRFLNVIGTPMSQFGSAAREVAGILNELENNTAATAGEILEMAETLAQLSSVAGVSMRDILAIGAGLKSMGIEAELAGTNTTKIFMDLVRAVSDGSTEVERWAAVAGMSKDEFIELARTQNGFSEALKMVATNLGRADLSAEEMTRTLDALGFVNAREKRIIIALAQGWEQFGRAVDVANDPVETAASIQRELAVRLDVTRVQFQLLKNRLAGVVQVIGEMLLPYIKDMIVWFDGNTEAIASFGAGVGWVIDAVIVLVGRFNALRLSLMALGSAFMATFAPAINIVGQFIEKVGTLARVFSMTMSSYMENMGYDRITASLLALNDVTRALNEAGGAAQALSVDMAEANAIQEEWLAKAGDQWFRAAQAFDAATVASEAMGANFLARKEEMMLGMVPLVDQLDTLAALSNAIDLDMSDLLDDDGEGAKKTARTIQDVLNELEALMAGIDRMAPVMDELGKEYDANAEKLKGLQTAITELVMEFGLTADSPELRKLIEQFLALGGAIDDVNEAIKKEMEQKLDVTESWAAKMVFLVEYGGMDANAAFRELEGAKAKLEKELAELALTPNRNMVVVEFVQKQLAAVEGALEAISDYTFVEMAMGRDPKLFPDGYFNVDEARAVQSQLEEMTRVWSEWDALVSSGGSDERLQSLYNSLWSIAEAGGVAADEAKRMLEAFGSTFYPDTNPRIIGIETDTDAGIAVGDGGVFIPDDEAADAEYLRQRTEALIDAILDYNRVTGEALTPSEALRATLERLAVGTDEVAVTAQALLAGLDEFDRAETAAEALEKFTEAQANVLKLTGEAPTPLRAAVNEYVALRDAALAAGDADMAANWFELINALLRFETLDTAGYADAMQEVEEALAGGEVKDDLMARLYALTQLGVGYEDVAAEASAAMVALQEYTRASAAAAAQEQWAADRLAQRKANYETLEEAIRGITSALEPELTQTERQIQQYEEIAFLLGDMGAVLEPYIQKLRDKAQAEAEQERSDAFITAMERVDSLMGRAPTAIQAYITELNALATQYPNYAAAIQVWIDQLEEYERITRETEANDALNEAISRSNSLMGISQSAIQAYIVDLEALKEKYPEITEAIDELIAKLEEYEAAQGGDDPLKEFREELDRLQGKAQNPFKELIEKLKLIEVEGEDANAELREMLDLLGKLSEDWEKTEALRAFASDLENVLSIAKSLFDLFQDGNWTDGNKLIEAFYDIGASVAMFIDPTGTLSGIISMVGEFVNSIIGDLSNGVRQVRQEIDDLAAESAFIGPELAESLTATERVSRGGLLGWLGFTKEQVNEELTGLRVGIAESFGSALKSGIQAALAGDTDWKTKLEEGLRDAIMDALLNAFIETALLTAGLADFINEFTRILTEEGADAAAAYASRNFGAVVDSLMEGAEILVDTMTDYGFATPQDPGEGSGDSGDFYEPLDSDFFSLPTATPGIITATPAWVDNLGMHFAKFGMYVDRLVDEGITVNVNGGSAGGNGITANDVRLLR